MWEIKVAIDGYNRGQGEDRPPEMSGAEFDDMIARNAEWIARQRVQ
jgi:hypothetical protein